MGFFPLYPVSLAPASDAVSNRRWTLALVQRSIQRFSLSYHSARTFSISCNSRNMSVSRRHSATLVPHFLDIPNLGELDFPACNVPATDGAGRTIAHVSLRSLLRSTRSRMRRQDGRRISTQIVSFAVMPWPLRRRPGVRLRARDPP